MHARTTLPRARPIEALAILVALLFAGLAAVTAVHPHHVRPTREASGPTDAPRQGEHTHIKAVARRAQNVQRVRWYAAVASTIELERARATQQLLVVAQQRRSMWEQLARCESAGNWNVVDRYGGGLGIYIGTWHMFNGDEFASNPGYASKDQQILVAERIYARFGLSGWGCAHNMGWVH